jgi:cobalt-zinc-cadmium efflux system membrane fusion protein
LTSAKGVHVGAVHDAVPPDTLGQHHLALEAVEDQLERRVVATSSTLCVRAQRPALSVAVVARDHVDAVLVPDNTDPMFSVGDLSTMWLVANVAEIDIPLVKVGQEVAVQVMAYPSEVFRARITYVGASVDPAVRRLTVRAEIPNSDDKLKPDMFASFRILTGAPTQSPGVPVSAIVREGDGTMTVWVTTDRKRLVKRTIIVGLHQDGFLQIVEGLQAGELVATESALFLGNMLTSGQ